MPKIKTLLSALLLSTALTLPTLAQETTKLSEDDRTDIRITVYNGNFAAISETRTLSVGQGLNLIEFADVSAQIQPETALLEGGEFTFLEQNFDYDLLTPGKLIEKAVGKTILVERTNPRTGRTTTEEALVLSTNGGVVLQFEDSIEIFGQGGLPERFSFTEIPDNLRAKPTLTTLVNATSNYDGDVRLSYLTGGFVWKADYVGNLSADETMMDIQAWVTLTNNSGTNFSNVRLQVLAGEVNRVSGVSARMEMRDFDAGFALAEAPKSESVGDFHLYTIPFKTDLKNNQTKQVALFAAEDVPVEKFYVFDARGRTQNFEPVLVYYEFDNVEENNLGNPIPRGIFRIYAKDSGGEAQFLGENYVPNTPEDQRVILPTGKAFDVTVMEKRTSYSRRDISPKEGTRQFETTTSKKVTFKNAKDEAVTVRFFEYFSGNWEITRQSGSHTAEDANRIYWEVEVPAKGEATLTYTKRTW
ncbi:MAG: DUF4139 domain-containing protein [Alphaproteobacteria bacterium]